MAIQAETSPRRPKFVVQGPVSDPRTRLRCNNTAVESKIKERSFSCRPEKQLSLVINIDAGLKETETFAPAVQLSIDEVLRSSHSFRINIKRALGVKEEGQ